MQPAYDPAIVLLGIYPKEMKTMVSQKPVPECLSNFIRNREKLGTAQVSLRE